MAHKQSLVGIYVFPFVLNLTLKHHLISNNIKQHLNNISGAKRITVIS